MAIRVLDMFCGISAFRSAAEIIGGFEFVGYCDNDPIPIAAYRTLYDTKGEKYFNDAKTIKTDEIPDFDILVGGFPCQPFSASGRKLAFKDERGTLFFELTRILAAKRPPFFIFENVPNIRTIEDGNLYHFRHNDEGEITAIEPNVKVNNAGSVLTNEKIDFGKNGYIEFTDDNIPNFIGGEDLSIDDYITENFSMDESEEQAGGMNLCQ